MGLNGDSGFRHFVFARLQEFAQRLDFTAHFVEHLAHGVHANFAALVAFEREANRKILGET